MSDFFLRLDSVTKRFENHLAVDRISLNVPRGQIYGLLGPNGAGKTTTIRMITGITVPDEGKIWFDGESLVPDHSRYVGYMPEERGLYPKMKVQEQINYLLTLKGLKASEAKSVSETWLEKLDLADRATSKTTELSKGNQQKVQFISTIGHEPKLLILDEPFTGLDPINTKIIEAEIHRLKEEGATIIFSTHRMEQVEELCDYIGLINEGQVILENDITSVRKQFQKSIYRLEFSGDKSTLDNLNGVTILERTDKHAMLKPDSDLSSRALMHQLADLPLEVLKFELHLPRLNEIFIELVGKNPFLQNETETESEVA